MGSRHELPAAELRQHCLFSTLTDVQWSTIVLNVKAREFMTRLRLFSQGDTGHAFFMLRCGVV